MLTTIATTKDLEYWKKTSIDIQDACNLSGVVYSFAQFLEWLRKEYPDKGTDWYNRHPICIMFSDKISSLTGDNFSFAYELVQTKEGLNY